jgi:hypothetical protein
MSEFGILGWAGIVFIAFLCVVMPFLLLIVVPIGAIAFGIYVYERITHPEQF